MASSMGYSFGTKARKNKARRTSQRRAFLFASLEESVGEVGFRERAEIVIERGLVGFLGTKSVGFSGDQF